MSQVFHREIALHQARGIGADRHRIGCRKALDPGRDVRGFTLGHASLAFQEGNDLVEDVVECHGF